MTSLNNAEHVAENLDSQPLTRNDSSASDDDSNPVIERFRRNVKAMLLKKAFAEAFQKKNSSPSNANTTSTQQQQHMNKNNINGAKKNDLAKLQDAEQGGNNKNISDKHETKMIWKMIHDLQQKDIQHEHESSALRAVKKVHQIETNAGLEEMLQQVEKLKIKLAELEKQSEAHDEAAKYRSRESGKGRRNP